MSVRTPRVEIEEVTPAEGRHLFDRAARELLGVSGDEFLQAYHAGAIPHGWPVEAVHELEMLVRFAE